MLSLVKFKIKANIADTKVYIGYAAASISGSIWFNIAQFDSN